MIIKMSKQTMATVCLRKRRQINSDWLAGREVGIVMVRPFYDKRMRGSRILYKISVIKYPINNRKILTMVSAIDTL